MARRKSEEDAVSLFPFLSILACLIGTLVLMIMALALSGMDTGVVRAAETYAQVAKQLQAFQASIVELGETGTRKESNGGDAQQQLAAARAELEQVEAQVAAAIEANRQPVDVKLPEHDAAAHQRQLAALQAELEKLRARIEQLLAELAQRKQPPEPAQVTIRPSGSGVDLEPTFVECNAHGIAIYEDSDSPYRIATGAIETDEKFLAHLERVASNPKASVVFLVRSDGLGAYYRAAALAKANYARNGKLPVVGQGKIDLSQFRAND